MKIHKDTSVIEFLETKGDFAKYGLKRTFRFFAKFKKNEKDLKGNRIITGYASTSHPDRDGDIITLDALKDAKDHLTQPGSSTVFYNHNRDIPIGRTLETAIDSVGLIVKVLISKAEDVEKYWVKIKEKILNSFSIGGRFKKVQVERDEEGKVIGFKVLKLDLYEVSVVGIPSNANANIFSVVEKSLKNFKDEERKDMVKKEEEKKDETKKEDIKKEETSKSCTEEMVKEMINTAFTALAPITKGLTEVMEGIKSITTKKEEKKKEEEEKKEEEIPTWAKTLQTAVDSLAEKVNKEPSRKGLAEDENDEEDNSTEEEETPEKCLDPNDPKSIPYVKWIMDDADRYNKLEKGEQQKANVVYFKLLKKASSKKD